MSSSEKDDHSEAPSEEDSEAERMLKISKRKLKSKSGQSKPSSSKKRRNSGKYSGLLDEEAAEMDDEEEDYDEGLRVLQIAPIPATKISRRKSYDVRTKLDVMKGYSKGINGSGINALSKKFGISPGTLRGWIGKKDNLEAAFSTTSTPKLVLRLQGGGRKPKFDPLETQLLNWVRSKNSIGIFVRDQFIRSKALVIFEQLCNEGQQAGIQPPLEEAFIASNGWLARFKCRKGLVSQFNNTNSGYLPQNAKDICESFVNKVRTMMSSLDVKPENVYNLDMLQLYFNSDRVMSHNMSHHRKKNSFIVTFGISQSGNFLRPHVTFQKTENKVQFSDQFPLLDIGIAVEDMKTGACSNRILDDYLKNTFAPLHESGSSKEPMLLLIGPSYKILDSDWLREMNMHVISVPSSLTALLQPLDIYVKNNFCEFYSENYSSFSKMSVDDNPSLKTKWGNKVKYPNYAMVACWVSAYAQHVSSEQIKESFQLCGISITENLDIQKLHAPLSTLLGPEFDLNDWNKRFASVFSTDFNRIDINSLVATDYFIPEKSGKIPSSLWQCIYRAVLAYGPKIVHVDPRIIYRGYPSSSCDIMGSGYSSTCVNTIDPVSNSAADPNLVIGNPNIVLENPNIVLENPNVALESPNLGNFDANIDLGASSIVVVYKECSMNPDIPNLSTEIPNLGTEILGVDSENPKIKIEAPEINNQASKISFPEANAMSSMLTEGSPFPPIAISKLGSFPKVSCLEYKQSVIRYMKLLPELTDITDDAFFNALERSTDPDYDIICYTVAHKEQCTVRVQNASSCTIREYAHVESTYSIDLILMNDFFVLKI